MNWNPARAVLQCVNEYSRHSGRGSLWSKLLCRFVLLKHRFWSIVSASDIDLRAKIGVNLRLPHPNGVIIHSDSIVGDNCMVMQQVTIGQLSVPGAPKIGSRVYIGAGAKVLGAINIGDGAVIGANAVVLCDVPSGYTAVGVPAIARPSKTRTAHGAPSKK